MIIYIICTYNRSYKIVLAVEQGHLLYFGTAIAKFRVFSENFTGRREREVGA